MKRQVPLGLLTLLVWVLLPQSGRACDCHYAGAPCKAISHTPTVFTGRVVKISTIDRKTASGDGYKDRLVFFDVERSYRGWEAKTAEVVTSMGDCGYDFHRGMRYLVYASPGAETGKLYTGICQRTRPLSEASEDIDYLSRTDDPSHAAGIEGSIEELDARSRTQMIKFLEGTPVLVEGPSGCQTVTSHGNGRFQLWGLSPGTYRVTPLLPKPFLPDEQTVKIERNSCGELRFLATPRERPLVGGGIQGQTSGGSSDDVQKLEGLNAEQQKALDDYVREHETRTGDLKVLAGGIAVRSSQALRTLFPRYRFVTLAWIYQADPGALSKYSIPGLPHRSATRSESE